MIFTKQNLILITMTVFIVCHQFADAERDTKRDPKPDKMYDVIEHDMMSKLPSSHWFMSKAEDKYFYTQSYFQADWHTANLFCNSFGMRLASVTSEGQQIVIQRDLVDFGFDKAESHFWISAHDISNEGTFYWVNGQRMSFQGWADGEPNNTKHGPEDEDCVEFWNKGKTSVFKWNDENCKNKYHFICELTILSP